jgi:predicted nucleic acid-binding protein
MALDKIYIDSCFFIEAVKTSVGDPTDADTNDIWYVQKCLEASKNGDIQVITSHLTIAESRKAKGEPSDKVKRLFNSILLSGKVLKLGALTQKIAELARDLEWQHGINLSGADAIHVATALKLQCKEFFTFDSKRKSPLKYKAELSKLGLTVIYPSETSLLPSKYLQRNIFDESGERNIDIL